MKYSANIEEYDYDVSVEADCSEGAAIEAVRRLDATDASPVSIDHLLTVLVTDPNGTSECWAVKGQVDWTVYYTVERDVLPEQEVEQESWQSMTRLPPHARFISHAKGDFLYRERKGKWQVISIGKADCTLYNGYWPDIPCKTAEEAKAEADTAWETEWEVEWAEVEE